MNGLACASARLRRGSPLALAVLFAAAVSMWGLAHESVHPYYAAAARSMSESWRSFAFGALDPSASISVDKLPGALWIQALSLRLFGPHVWALMLPQAAEGVAATALLHRLVRRWAGAAAATAAALIFATTPAVVVTERSELADPLLILLSLVAAGSLAKALERPDAGALLRCGLWVALAFQVKMAQAWLLLPVFATVYVVEGPVSPTRRWIRATVMCVIAIGASLVYVCALWLIPPAHRPYADGTVDNNPFAMVFGYNALDRFGQTPAGQAAIVAAGTPLNTMGWRTLLDPVYFAPQYAWMAPLALAGLGIAFRRFVGATRGDGTRAGFLLWGGWLLVHVVAFCLASAFHGYYTADMAPALAALAGDAAVRLYRAQGVGGVRALALPLVLVCGAGWAVWLDAHHTQFMSWLSAVTVAAGFGAALGLAVAAHGRMRSLRSAAVPAACALAACALLIAPASWALSALNPLYYGTPFAPMAGPVGSNHHTVVDLHRSLPEYGVSAPGPPDAVVSNYLRAHRGGARYLTATAGAGPAEPLLDSGAGPVLVIGGFTGLAPFPSAAATGFANLAASGVVRFAVLPLPAPDTATDRWIAATCTVVSLPGTQELNGTVVTLYDCGPAAVVAPLPASTPAVADLPASG